MDTPTDLGMSGGFRQVMMGKKKSIRSVTNKVRDIQISSMMRKMKSYENRYRYLDKLILLSELCMTSGLRSNVYGKDLSDLCLDILNKESVVWQSEFQQFEELLDLDQRIEYFIQNCLVVIENNKQDEKVILMSLTHLSCIDYPKDDRVQSLGARCVHVLKKLLTRDDDFKELVEKSILEIIIQNIKQSNWIDVKEIQINGIISFLEIPNIPLLFLLDEDILPLMHKWIGQVQRYLQTQNGRGLTLGRDIFVI